MPERVQLSRAKGWRMPPNTARVDRASLFGNPFHVEKAKVSGGPERWVNVTRYMIRDSGSHYATKDEASAEAVLRFRAWINHPANRKHREMCVVGLRGKNLACWCKPGRPCHADILLGLANKVHLGNSSEP